ncbi:uncharacterized protein BCR38DRAFT_480295 [Pseudomassariella vexata]|uniref:Uncharacterized protein n=1 Tax=Pseudomassariella vexata TaxID=1141098 RepID=A0A1Y2EKK0_9PEZI|nr:uncharacterized protein BCR38DRAFT_480295 [Pseudomassariella vexata]ORY71816.1 hypothetical protein BCR38DRAFT_480295 [Pseudomassariella vexata]
MISPSRAPRQRMLILALLLAPSIFMYLYHILPAIRKHILQHPSSSSSTSRLDFTTEYPPNPNTGNISVNLVLATVSKDDISWTSKLHQHIPNLNLIRYISDDPSATYHPPAAKGREALMYHTYFYDFYDSLPDVSILVHAHETAWHVDAALRSSMVFSLSRLDLTEAQKLGYVNLRASWYQACPAWINTTKTPEESEKQEEPWMGEAFRANFGREVQTPEILAGPCCSQFAVSREAVRSRPRDQYKRSMEWLLETEWSDYIAGRTWEHMWAWLFKEVAVDCAVEYKKLCRMYGVCFEGQASLDLFNDLFKEKEGLREATEFWRELWDPDKAQKARDRMGEIEGILDRTMGEAVRNGGDYKAHGLWKKFNTVVLLKEQGVQDQADLDMLNNRCYRAGRRIPWESGITVVTPLNKNRWNLNMEAALSFQRQRGAVLQIFPSDHRWKDSDPTEEEVLLMLSQGDDSAIPVPAIFISVPGMPVVVNQNNYQGLKVVNGAGYTAVDVIVDKARPGYHVDIDIILHFGPPAGIILESETTKDFDFVGMASGTVLVTLISTKIERHKKRPWQQSNVVRKGLPCAAAFACKDCKVQGRTLAQIGLELRDTRRHHAAVRSA